MTKDNFEQEIKKWEKAFEKKMKKEEKVMFKWGLVYGVEKTLKVLKKEMKNEKRK